MNDIPVEKLEDHELDRLLELVTAPDSRPLRVYRGVTLRRGQTAADVDGRILLRDSEVDGRWNPYGVRTMYTSVHLPTCGAEVARIKLAQSAGNATLGMAIGLLDVSFSEVVDLSDPRVLVDDFGLDLDPHGKPPDTYVQRGGQPTTRAQQLGAAVFDLGFAGLLVPSVQRWPYPNLVIFPTNVQMGDDVDVPVDGYVLDDDQEQ